MPPNWVLERSNIDADTLSRCPLDINTYMSQCSEGLSEEAVYATWEGSRTAQQGEVAWMEALNIASQEHTNIEPFPVIDHNELVTDQQKDPVIGRILELKGTNTELTEVIRNTLDKDARKPKRVEPVICGEWPPL